MYYDTITKGYMTRGLRNNNPGNIVKGAGKPFQGEVVPSTDSRFRQFATMEHGYRAILKLLVNYVKGGHDTIHKIINRWAPSNENNTANYISIVEAVTEINRNQVILPTDAKSLTAIAAAISFVENGVHADLPTVIRAWGML